MHENEDPFREFLASKKFDVEHALGIYAFSYFCIPAEAIYENDLEDKLGDQVRNCHIYMIGYTPKLDLKQARQEGTDLWIDFEVQGELRSISWPLGEGLELKTEGDLWYVADRSGNRFVPLKEDLLVKYTLQHGPLPFKIMYVGQAYGTDGSRHALDRLRKHETLQKIAVKGVPDNYQLQLMLLEINPANQVYSFFNPFASQVGKDDGRIAAGLDKLYGTDESERITLYEASLIRHFQPPFNIEFKNSFPSTNLKVLADCYDKDFTSLITEFCFDSIEYALYSDAIELNPFHIIQHDLHKEEERRVFFGLFE